VDKTSACEPDPFPQAYNSLLSYVGEAEVYEAAEEPPLTILC